MTPDEIRAVVRAVFDEEDARRIEIADAAALKAVTTVLTSFGLADDERAEVRADFTHLRKWRKSVEQAQAITFKAMLTALVAGVLGAIWLGLKGALGK